MKKCKNCGNIVFACCGNEPGDFCYGCEKKLGVSPKACKPPVSKSGGSFGLKNNGNNREKKSGDKYE